jgi:hypothetical protein
MRRFSTGVRGDIHGPITVFLAWADPLAVDGELHERYTPTVPVREEVPP